MFIGINQLWTRSHFRYRRLRVNLRYRGRRQMHWALIRDGVLVGILKILRAILLQVDFLLDASDFPILLDQALLYAHLAFSGIIFILFQSLCCLREFVFFMFLTSLRLDRIEHI